MVLGRDCLSHNLVHIYCAKRELIFSYDEIHVIVKQEYCELNVTDVRDELDQISVLRVFLQVFTKDFPGVPPECEVVFEILLEAHYVPTSVPPYRMNNIFLLYLDSFVVVFIDDILIYSKDDYVH